jgi:glycosyltransferase involved in cell wall biosynthesis
LETIRSIRDQTYQNWELLIIDDGSTDETCYNVQQLSVTEKRVKLIKRNRLPKGAPTCRNIGLEIASGEFLLFLDSDDLLSPTCIEKRVIAFESYPGKDFIVFYSAFFSHSISDAAFMWNRFDKRDDLSRFLQADVVWHTSSSFWKTGYLKKNGLFYTEMAQTSQDWEFHLRVLLKKPSYIKIHDTPDSFIRRNDQYDKISDEHQRNDRTLNRIELMNQILKQPDINKDPGYTKLFCITIMREFHILQNNGGHFEKKFLVPVNAAIKQYKMPISSAYTFIKLGNSFIRKNYSLFRLFRKIFYPLMVKDLFNYSGLFRSPMTQDEINDLRRITTVGHS